MSSSAQVIAASMRQTEQTSMQAMLAMSKSAQRKVLSDAATHETQSYADSLSLIQRTAREIAKDAAR
jgi:hypothetical protein